MAARGARARNLRSPYQISWVRPDIGRIVCGLTRERRAEDAIRLEAASLEAGLSDSHPAPLDGLAHFGASPTMRPSMPSQMAEGLLQAARCPTDREVEALARHHQGLCTWRYRQ